MSSSNEEQTKVKPMEHDDEKVDVQFGNNNEDSEIETETEKKEDKPDLSKYTVIEADHLDEDDIADLQEQKYCLLSFMSPEGIMNCNVRAVKFRGAFPTKEAAEKKASELKKKDKYFNIFSGETGKWLDFDPPASRVEEEKSFNKQQQKILEQQRKQRMQQLNTLSERTKEMIDKKDKGKTERIDEYKKTSAANDAVEKQRNKKQEKVAAQEEKKQKIVPNTRAAAAEKIKERLRKRMGESKNKKVLENLEKERTCGRIDEGDVGTVDDDLKNTKTTKSNNKDEIEEKVKVVGKASEKLEEKKAALYEADKNIEKIRQFMNKSRNNNK
jgi:hypothetical protein